MLIDSILLEIQNNHHDKIVEMLHNQNNISIYIYIYQTHVHTCILTCTYYIYTTNIAIHRYKFMILHTFNLIASIDGNLSLIFVYLK